jgi:hypothetical protein
MSGMPRRASHSKPSLPATRPEFAARRQYLRHNARERTRQRTHDRASTLSHTAPSSSGSKKRRRRRRWTRGLAGKAARTSAQSRLRLVRECVLKVGSGARCFALPAACNARAKEEEATEERLRHATGARGCTSAQPRLRLVRECVEGRRRGALDCGRKG